jgi:acetylornithine deacetylase/succinyl-diaminopimelate desuccinylase-like protein
MPDLGINPHFSMANFMSQLRSLQMTEEPPYGRSSVVPTRVTSEPESANVTPGALQLVLDWRNVPGESPEAILTKLEAPLARSLEPGCEGQVEIAAKELVTYTGLRMAYPDTFPSFTTAADHPWLLQAQTVLTETLGRQVEVDTWRFATDGGHFAAAGTTVIGFGPGDAGVVHTVEERMPLDELVESVVGYLALSLT